MPESRLDSVRDTLEHELELAESEVGRLKEELKAADAERKAIGDALAALGRKKASKGANAKPAPKGEQVRRMVASLLDANGPMQQSDLEDLVKDRLVEHGYSQVGFGLRFSEALKHDAIRAEGGVIALATQAVMSR